VVYILNAGAAAAAAAERLLKIGTGRQCVQ